MLKITLLAACVLCAAAPAFAQDAAAPETRVSYADLNLATSAGIATFDTRLAMAVKEVCGDADARDLRRWAMVRSCRTEAKGRAAHARAAVLASMQPNSSEKALAVATK